MYLVLKAEIMSAIKRETDVGHVYPEGRRIYLLLNRSGMFFSKSFGYAVRGVLYIAVRQKEKSYVQVEEIASSLSVPRHFMGKILKKLAKHDILESVKGPTGGFALAENTLSLPLISLIDLMDGLSVFRSCVLRLDKCNATNPCPLHHKMIDIRNSLCDVLTCTTIADLLAGGEADILKGLATSFELTV
jgi:Rrf2 family transcriptional regulator, iron-sulfur cluster assembly transcription factor